MPYYFGNANINPINTMMAKFNLLLLIICFAATSLSMAQHSDPNPELQAQMAKLEFLTGNWAGTGWMKGSDGQRHGFDQTEDIRFRLSGTVLLIEGRGEADGQVIHDALAIITYNKETGNYKFQSWLPSGLSGTFKAELIENRFYWYPQESMRYIIWINDEGQWYETGEMFVNDSWMQFFEMTLEKVDP